MPAQAPMTNKSLQRHSAAKSTKQARTHVEHSWEAASTDLWVSDEPQHYSDLALRGFATRELLQALQERVRLARLSNHLGHRLKRALLETECRTALLKASWVADSNHPDTDEEIMPRLLLCAILWVIEVNPDLGPRFSKPPSPLKTQQSQTRRVGKRHAGF
eukprot:CAMPEP_0203920966 /NCGR_PEP_ID=MMETSP0359-20131031/61184_1 /ASSEMBLY_ACC=CAM_ASM_000338 /TAXON_ID=268821 /ORGANISM="Scrippsiella Hangoei, Strain SHTV-5" /LENGTH=160 /DNA_ID=CAMNT_0050848565 /DNA_START=68 /DNA_END=550 /DNA_ORIENTATION=+